MDVVAVRCPIALRTTAGGMVSVCLAEIIKPTEKVYWQTEI